jgi:hypothetical protein
MNKYALLMLAAVNVSMGSHFEGSRVQHDAVTESTLGRHKTSIFTGGDP